MVNEPLHTGRCLCGQVRFEARGAPNWVAHCHCASCRRATSAAFATYVGYAAAAVTWSGLPRREYASSQGVVRSFCSQCGSPMSFQGAGWLDEIHLFAASFDDADSLLPQLHEHTDEKLSWVQLADGLPHCGHSAGDLLSAPQQGRRP